MIADQITAFTNMNTNVAYYSGGGDANRDGTPDRAQIGDGNGVDCSGWVWILVCYLARLGYYTGLPSFPLGSTSTYSAYGRAHGWLVTNLQAGDIVIHASGGDPYHSDGPSGHTGMVVSVLPGGRVLTSESAGSGNGVDLYTRPRSFWILAVRLPLALKLSPIGTEDVMTPGQEAKVDRVLALQEDLHVFMGQSRGPDNQPMVAWLWHNQFQNLGHSITNDLIEIAKRVETGVKRLVTKLG